MQVVAPVGGVGGGLHFTVQGGEGMAHLGEQTLAVDGVAEYLAERYGVGCIAGEAALVDVDPHADDAAGNGATLDVVFDEDAAEFVVAVVDVVGPLDAYFVGIVAEDLAERYGDEFADDELLRCTYAMGCDGEAE